MAEFARDEVEAAFRAMAHAGEVRWSYPEHCWLPAEPMAGIERDQEASAQHDPGHPPRRARRDGPTAPSWAAPGPLR